MVASWLLHADDKASKMRHEKCMKTCNENAPDEELQVKIFQKVIFDFQFRKYFSFLFQQND